MFQSMMVFRKTKRNEASLDLNLSKMGKKKKPKSFKQAALLVTNGLAVLNNDRCLEKCRESRSLDVGKRKREETERLLCLLTLSKKKKKNGKKNSRRQTTTGGLGYSQIGRAADGLHPGPSLMRKQVVEFLHAVTYLRGELAGVLLAAMGEAATTGALTGLPLPAISILRAVNQQMKNNKTKARIAQALNKAESSQ